MRIRNNCLGATATAALIASLAMAGPALAQDASSAGTTATASANLMNSDGENVGTVALVETPNGLLVQLDATGLPAEGHGFHIHTTGQCDAPDFKSAGGHFNPGDSEHGFLNENGPHAGDLPNIWPGEDGAIRADFFVHELTISEGDMALLDDDGAAFMIHATVDDYETDPAGDAGNRIACGVIEVGEAPEPGTGETQSQ